MKQSAGGTINEASDIPQITEYTESMFAKNDHDFREGQTNQEIAEVTIFYYAELPYSFQALLSL